jgi:peptide-methionine (S)-S-oxide reductase
MNKLNLSLNRYICILSSILGIVSLFISFSVNSQDDKTATQLATFAGGCFWTMQSDFDSVPGVVKTVVGYGGGKEASPTYEEVALGQTSHVETIQITFDPTKTNYQSLLDVYWNNIDPIDSDGQFCDRGHQYHTVIFYHDDNQKKLAMSSKDALLLKNMGEIATEIRPLTTFYPAEEDQQEYYLKNSAQYKFYRVTCGRDKRLKEIWDKK